MQKIILIHILAISGLLVMPGSIWAQKNDPDDSIMSIKTSWRKKENYIHAYDPAIKSNHFPFILGKIDSLATFLKEAYPKPAGTEPTWYAHIQGMPVFPGGPSPYAMYSLFHFYYHNSKLGKIVRSIETSTWAYAFVNEFRWLLDSTGLNFEKANVENKIWILSPENGKWKGNTVFEPRGFAPNVKMVVVTKTGDLPLKPVTEMQYLLALKEKKLGEKKKLLEDYDAGIAKNQKTIDDLQNNNNYNPEVKSKLISAAQEQLNKLNRDKNQFVQNVENLFGKDLKVIEEYMHDRSAASMDKPAFINAYHDFIFQEKFEDPDSKEARKVVYIDRSWFNRSLPGYQPQFVTLMWRWNHNTPCLSFKEQFEEKFPVEKIKAMLK